MYERWGVLLSTNSVGPSSQLREAWQKLATWSIRLRLRPSPEISDTRLSEMAMDRGKPISKDNTLLPALSRENALHGPPLGRQARPEKGQVAEGTPRIAPFLVSMPAYAHVYKVNCLARSTDLGLL
jgi:hypothetical protein